MPVRNMAVPILIFIVSLVLTGCGTDKTVTSPHPAAAARFAVVANSLANSISTYTIDPQSGLLSPKENVPTGGGSSRVIAVEPSGRFAYVGNIVSNDISVFSIDANTGRLLWDYKLPAGGYATPCTYSVNAKQYVTIAAGGGGKLRTPSGDAFITFSLP